MRKHSIKIIAAVVILAALTIAWFHGENYTSIGDDMLPVMAAQATEASSLSGAATEMDLQVAISPELETVDIEIQTTPDEPLTESIVYEIAQEENNTEFVSGPEPAVPQDVSAVADDGSFTVTLSVRADTILNNMHLLREEKHHLVPVDGIIFPATVVRVYEGESVFNVLQREMRRAGIHMAFRNTPIYNSAYVVGINNLYEFDVGNLSGWMYKVNGLFPNFGSSRYILSPGDVIEWIYTCDLGRDVGGCWLAVGQRDD